jgi:glycosyltransferase involved in cell wall biosynthesis
MPSETFVRRHLTEISPGATYGIVRQIINADWCPGVERFEMSKAPEGSFASMLRSAGFTPENNRTRELRCFLDRNEVNVVMGEWLNFSAKWHGALKASGRRFVAHAHGYDITLRALSSASKRWLYRKLHEMDALVTVSELGKQRLITTLGLDSAKIHVIPCGVDIPPPRETPRHEDSPLILCVGRMVPKKGQRITLEAFARASEFVPGLRLEFIGDGPELESCRAFAADKKLLERVVFHGSKSQDFVMERMKAADIFALHSVTAPDGDEEGLPVALLEAMACGLPVLTTRHAGIPEAVIDGEHGYLVNERDAEALFERMLELAQDPSLCLRMGVAARERAVQSFSAASEIERLRAILFSS